MCSHCSCAGTNLIVAKCLHTSIGCVHFRNISHNRKMKVHNPVSFIWNAARQSSGCPICTLQRSPTKWSHKEAVKILNSRTVFQVIKTKVIACLNLKYWTPYWLIEGNLTTICFRTGLIVLDNTEVIKGQHEDINDHMT